MIHRKNGVLLWRCSTEEESTEAAAKEAFPRERYYTVALGHLAKLSLSRIFISCVVQGNQMSLFMSEFIQGRLILGDGSVYEGMWRYGKKSGPGAFYFTNGDVFQGSWRDDAMHGKVCSTF